jgi:predicted RNA-binding protein with PUA-like domain
MNEGTRHWLMKSEPDELSIAELARRGVEPWTGVRSVFARFHMRQMQIGDDVLFYHSSVEPPHVAGLARVARTGVIDETQFDERSKYFDAKATREKPIWDCVDVEYVATFPHPVPIARIRAEPALGDMVLLRIGRLSVQPVTAQEFARVVELGQTAWEPPPKAKTKTKKKKKSPPKRQSAKKKTKKRKR